MLCEIYVWESLNLIKMTCTCHLGDHDHSFLLLPLLPLADSSDLEPDLDDAVSGSGDEVPVLGLAQRHARYPVVVT